MIYWVVIRSFRKMIKYAHRHWRDDVVHGASRIELEWFFVTALTYTFFIEYLVSVFTIFVTIDIVRESEKMKIDAVLFTFNLSVFYYIFLFLSIPYFLQTMVWTCKRRRIILHRYNRTGKKSSNRSIRSIP